MKQKSSLSRAQRIMLVRSLCVLISPILMTFTMIACGTIITDIARYTCPTQPPQPTSTTLFGTPFPTPSPLPTPYIILPPQEFYVGDAVFVGQPNAPFYIRFRLQQVKSQPASPLGSNPRHLVTWQVEIRNLGSTTYETIPVALMVITRINTASGEQTGIWRTSETAMKAAGFTNENDDPLLPGTTRMYRLAAYVPSGSVRQFVYLLDGNGNNRITWINAANPTCSGDVAA